MSFAYPTFLWALAAIALPIIIHLFYFRRFKKVYFTNVNFLKEVKEERSTRNRLKHLLVLLSRILTVAFLVLAFAQPFLPQKENVEQAKGEQSVSIYLDNSFSMGLRSSAVSLFDKAKQKAREIANAFPADTRFQLLTNDFEGRHQRLLNKEQFMAYLEETNISPQVRSLNEVLERQRQALAFSNAERKNLFMVSDFQRNGVDMENDTSFSIYMVPLQSAERRNLYIDSVWFDSPMRLFNQANKLLVRIVNAGDADVEDNRLELRINGKVKSIKEFNATAGSSVTDTINFTITETGWHNAILQLEDHEIDFDDTYFFTFEVTQQVNVFAINQAGTNPYLKTLFDNDKHFKFENRAVNKITDINSFPNQQLIVLNGLRQISSGLAQSLADYVTDGGSLLIFPGENIDFISYNSFLKSLHANTYTKLNDTRREIDKINTRQEVFKDVFERIPKNMDLPDATKSYDLTSFSNTTEEVILSFKDGGSFLSKYTIGAGGKLYITASPANAKYTSLPSHAIFVPMIYKIALGGSKSGRLAYTIGEDKFAETLLDSESNNPVFKLKGDAGESIPSTKTLGSKLIVGFDKNVKDAGIYELSNNDKTLHNFGFNYNRRESVLDFFSLEELKKRFNFSNITFLEDKNEGALQKRVGELNKGIELWKWCLLLALLFLLIETLLLRLWKT